MREWQSLSHVKWECKYHVVIVPKYRKKVLYGRLRGEVGKIIRQLCRQKEVELIEGHAMPDHIHLVLSVPPKYSIAMVLGYLKGKSAIHIHRTIHGIKQGFTGRHFWSRGYCGAPCMRTYSQGGSPCHNLMEVKCSEAQGLVRPGKVAQSSGWEPRLGRLASHRVASPWRLGGNVTL